MNITEQKKTLRKLVKERIFALDNREELSAIICQKALNYALDNDAKKVAVYYPLSDEVDTRLLIDSLISYGIEVYLPVVDNGNMYFALYNDKENLNSGAFGVQEPISGILNTDFDIVFTPLRAFDKNNNRLGRGGGYYDRVLPKLSAKKVGIAYSCQRVDTIPTCDYDFPLDLIITD